MNIVVPYSFVFFWKPRLPDADYRAQYWHGSSFIGCMKCKWTRFRFSIRIRHTVKFLFVSIEYNAAAFVSVYYIFGCTIINFIYFSCCFPLILSVQRCIYCCRSDSGRWAAQKPIGIKNISTEIVGSLLFHLFLKRKTMRKIVYTFK